MFASTLGRPVRYVWNWYQNSRCAEREARGLRLLREWLSTDQLAQFDAHRYFDVIGCQTGKRYRIRYGAASNIFELDDKGNTKAGWCFVPKDSLVPGDVMLAQKIALETDEWSALAVAKKLTVGWRTSS